MKKILVLSILLSFGICAYAEDFGSVGGLMNDIGGMQNPYSQLKLLEEQKFRQEEYNDFQDMKDVKAKRNQKIELEQEYAQIQQQQKQQRSLFNNTDNNIEFKRENGQLMLKRID